MNMRGVGTSIQRYSNVAVTIATWICVSQHRAVLGQSCASSSCSVCLDQNCVWFTLNSVNAVAGECLEACGIIPKVPCYNFDLYPNESVESICATAETDVTDWTTCSLALDCTSCVSLLQTDGVSPCAWYEEGNFCGSGVCTDYGCGSTMCNNTPVAAPTTSVVTAPTNLCNVNATTCEECLISMDNGTETPYSCGWSTNRCIESCADATVGSACYSVEAYPELVSTPNEICRLEQSATMDVKNMCTNATTCTTCTDLLQSDGKTVCLWFEDEDVDVVTPYCSAHNHSISSVARIDANGCDLNGICGVSDCSMINVTGNAVAPNAAPRKSNTTSGSGCVTVWLHVIWTALLSIGFTMARDMGIDW